MLKFNDFFDGVTTIICAASCLNFFAFSELAGIPLASEGYAGMISSSEKDDHQKLHEFRLHNRTLPFSHLRAYIPQPFTQL
jgi:hypothetical protein